MTRQTHYKIALRLWVAMILVFICLPNWAAEKITLHALFKNKAIIMVDGSRHVVSAGQATENGVKLISTDTAKEEAVVEIDGKRTVLRLGIVMQGSLAGGKSRITLYADPSGHFITSGAINDKPVEFLVDTGATKIAINSRTANYLGIDYKALGRPSVASTAGGVIRVYDIILRKVSVGGITLNYVDASVIEGNFLQKSLLGMSFLGKLDMRREGTRLELIKQ